RKPVTRPGCTVNDRSSTACVLPYRLLSARASITRFTLPADSDSSGRGLGAARPHQGANQGANLGAAGITRVAVQPGAGLSLFHQGTPWGSPAPQASLRHRGNWNNRRRDRTLHAAGDGSGLVRRAQVRAVVPGGDTGAAGPRAGRDGARLGGGAGAGRA